MAAITATPDSAETKIYTAVYYKMGWTDGWIYDPHIEPLAAAYRAAPLGSSATLRMRYGSGLWEDLEAMEDGADMESFLYCYIQLRQRRGEEEKTIWTGVVPAETFSLLGQSGTVKTADQVIQAQGLEFLLRNRLDGAWVLPAGGTEATAPVWINHVPVFNRRHEYGVSIIGNRSTLPGLEKNTYVFSPEGSEWSNLDIAEYLLEHYNFENGPQFLIAGDIDILDALDGVVEVQDLRTETVFSALNRLISRGRGFCWYIEVGGDGSVYVVVCSMLDEPIMLDEIVMPANPNRMPLELWENSRHVEVEVTADSTNTYDRIVIEGARMKSCCSLSFDKAAEIPHPSLEMGWTDAEETAYKDAAKNTTGYGSLSDDEKAALNDKFRMEDRFERVFAALRVPYDWDWIVGSGEDEQIVSPFIDIAGELHIDTASTHWNADKKFENILPFKSSFDYSGTTAIDKNPANSEPEFRRMFVLVKDADGKYQYADKYSYGHAMMRPMTREMGVEIVFDPQYFAAKNHWTGAEPGEWEDDIAEAGIDYEEVVATVFIETDQPIRAVHAFNYYENQRTLMITIADAELWYVVPGTIININDSGDLIEFGCTDKLLRDDRSRIRAALNAAMAWYSKQRNKLAITSREIDPGVPIGTLIEKTDIAGTGAVGSIVTEVSWNFQPKAVSTAIVTDHGELDIVGVFSR